MRTQFLNRLRNVKEWLELQNLPFFGRFAAARLFRPYQLDRTSVARLWESDPDALYIPALIGPGAVVLDVGANLGTFCYTVLRANPSARVIAFEPIPALAARLRGVFRNIEVMELALSDHRSVEVFRIPYIDGRRCSTRGSLAPMVDSGTWQQIQVHTARLDDLVPTLGLNRLDLVKIDVEGHEVQVVAGAERTLRQHQPLLLVEIEQRHHSGQSVVDIMHYIESLGYLGYFLNRSTLEFDPIVRFNPDTDQRAKHPATNQYINNFLFISKHADSGTIRGQLTTHLRHLLRGSHLQAQDGPAAQQAG